MVLTLNDLKARFRSTDRPSQNDWEDMLDTLYDAARRAVAAEIADRSITPIKISLGAANKWFGTNEAGEPDWRDLPSGAPAVPTGSAGGDLDGTYPNPSIRNKAVTLLKFNPDEAVAGGAGAVLTYTGINEAPFRWALPNQPYVVIKDIKSSSTQGGDFFSGDWRVRTLNNLAATVSGISTLSANSVTLSAGVWRCRITCPAYRVNWHVARLFNVTANAIQLVGTSERSDLGGGDGDESHVVTHSTIVGFFTLPAAQVLRVEHRCQSSNTGGLHQGFGIACGFGVDEVYTVAEFWKIG